MKKNLMGAAAEWHARCDRAGVVLGEYGAQRAKLAVNLQRQERRAYTARSRLPLRFCSSDGSATLTTGS